MNYEEAKLFLYKGQGSSPWITPDHKRYMMSRLGQAIGTDNIEDGLLVLKQLTHCEDTVAKLLWVDMCQDYGETYREVYGNNEPQQSQEQYVPKCPTCGSPDIQKISGTKRWVTTGLFGVASGDLGKTMVCKNCGFKW